MEKILALTLLIIMLTGLMNLTAYAASPVLSIDTQNKTEVYSNTFDSPDALSEFKQYNGKFTVSDGRARLSSYTKSTNAFMLYDGKALDGISDYVVEVDLYNVQTAAGLVAFCETERAAELIHGYSGYNIFTNSTGQKLALRSSGDDGKSTPTLKVCSWRINPGDDIHIEAAVSKDIVQVRFTDLHDGREIWAYSTVNTEHRGKGFGLMAYTKIYDGKLDCRKSSFDNLKVSKLESTSSKEYATVSGSFKFSGSTATSESAKSLAILKGGSLSSGSVSAKTYLPKADKSGVVFSYSEDGSYYKFGISSDKKLHLIKVQSSKSTTLKTTSLSAMGAGPWGVCELRAVYDKGSIYCYINNMCLLTYKDSAYLSGEGFGIFADNAGETLKDLRTSSTTTPDSADIVIFGHSHMQGWYDAVNTLSKHGRVANLGVGGSNTPYWNKLTDEISSYGADIVIVMSGSNDLKSYQNTQTAKTLSDTFNKIKANNPNVHFILITEWFQPSRIETYEDKVRDMEKLWRELADKSPELVTIVDGFSIPLDNTGKFSDAIFSDTQHFGILGYRELETRVMAALDNVKAKVFTGGGSASAVDSDNTQESTTIALDTTSAEIPDTEPMQNAPQTTQSNTNVLSIVILSVSITVIGICIVLMILLTRKKK